MTFEAKLFATALVTGIVCFSAWMPSRPGRATERRSAYGMAASGLVMALAAITAIWRHA